MCNIVYRCNLGGGLGVCPLWALRCHFPSPSGMLSKLIVFHEPPSWPHHPSMCVQQLFKVPKQPSGCVECRWMLCVERASIHMIPRDAHMTALPWSVWFDSTHPTSLLHLSTCFLSLCVYLMVENQDINFPGSWLTRWREHMWCGALDASGSSNLFLIDLVIWVPSDAVCSKASPWFD